MKQPPTQKLITRGEIAQMLGVSIRFVADNEITLGIAGCRVVLGPRIIRYRELDVRAALAIRGVR